MRKRLINFVVLFVVLCCIALPIGVVNVHAGNCYREECEGLNPETMGCSGYTGLVVYVAYGGVVETRKSGDCETKWARTKNRSGLNRFAGATVRYGGDKYIYHYSVSSPAPISHNDTVYTAMTAPFGKVVVSCGLLNPYSPVGIPISLNIDVWCTKAN